MTYPTRKRSPRRPHAGRRLRAELDRMFPHLLSSFRAPDGGLLVRGGPFEVLHISGRALREAQQLRLELKPLVTPEFEPLWQDPRIYGYGAVISHWPSSIIVGRV